MSTARGIRMLQALEGYRKREEHCRRWDAANVFSKMTLETAGEGRLRGHFLVEASMCNSGDYLHGGFVASLIDTISLFGYVSHPLGRVAWTTNLQLHLTRKAQLGERVEVETTPLMVHRRGGLVDCSLRNAAGELVARGTVSLATPGPSAQQFCRDVATNLRFDFEDEN